MCWTGEFGIRILNINCEQRPDETHGHMVAHPHDFVKLAGENELLKLFPSILARRVPYKW